MSSAGSEEFKFSSTSLAATTTGGALITSGNGTAAAPAFSFVGDPGTGWFRPSAGLLAASTLGTERMRLDNLGQVGIGTTTPYSALHLATSGTSGLTTQANRGITLTDNNGPRITLENTSLGVNAKAWVIHNDGTNLSFSALNDNGASWAGYELVNLTRGGNVGIGTPTPQASLDINGTVRLAEFSSQPAVCGPGIDGMIVRTSQYTLCICNGNTTNWVLASDGSTACSF